MELWRKQPQTREKLKTKTSLKIVRETLTLFGVELFAAGM
jgi:hypothetical protein